MTNIAEWLRDSALNDFLEPQAWWLIPVIQIIHILSIAVVLSSMLMLNARLLRASLVNQTVPQLTRRFLPWVWIALAVLLVSGATLIMMEPVRTLGKALFWAKMAAVLVAALMTLGLQRRVESHPEAWAVRGPDPALAGFAALNIGLWLFIIVAGRWIAYV